MKRFVCIILVILFVMSVTQLAACNTQSGAGSTDTSSNETDMTGLPLSSASETSEPTMNLTDSSLTTPSESSSVTTDADPDEDYAVVTPLRLAYTNPFRNIASGGKIVASSGGEGAYAPTNLIDNDAYSMWRGSVNGLGYITVDLGKEVDFNTYTLMLAGGHGETRGSNYLNMSDWEIYISPDNKNWKRVDSRSNNRLPDISVYITPQRGRYVKLNVLKPSQDNDTNIRIYEFGLYNLAKSDYYSNLPEDAAPPTVPIGSEITAGASGAVKSITAAQKDNGTEVSVTFSTAKTTNDFLNWYFIAADGTTHRYMRDIKLSSDKKTVTFTVQSLPIKSGKNTLYLQMGASSYVGFSVTGKNPATLGWVEASYNRNHFAVLLTAKPSKEIKLGDSFEYYAAGSETPSGSMYVYTTEGIRYSFRCDTGMPEGDIRITINGANLYFHNTPGTWADGFEFATGTVIAGLSTMYVTMENSSVDPNNIPREYQNSKMTLVDPSGKYMTVTDLSVGIKTRGNYSASFDKKPYAVKLESKRSLLGMGSAKKYVLINGYTDKTYLRNYMTFMAGIEMGLVSTPEVRLVNVVVNGDYRGIYTLSQKIAATKNVVDIDDENGGIIFEIEMEYRHGDHSNCISLPSGAHITIHEPDLADLTPDRLAKVVTDARAILGVIDLSLPRGYAEFSKYIDIPSFIDWYILNELTRNHDSQFVTSCYCYYNEKDGKLYMGPLWDYDTCYGNQQDSKGAAEEMWVCDAPWYKILLADPTFKAALKARYAALRKDGYFEWFIDTLYKSSYSLLNAADLDTVRWPEFLKGDMHGNSNYYSSEVIAFADFVYRRMLFFDKQWK